MQHHRPAIGRQCARIESGEREQQRAVDPLGDVFLRLAHVDQHDRAVMQSVMHFGWRQFMQLRFRVHHRLLFGRSSPVDRRTH